MTNEQLASLLQHIGRQINLHASEVEQHQPVCKELEMPVVQLRGLASLLFDQAKACGGLVGSMPS